MNVKINNKCISLDECDSDTNVSIVAIDAGKGATRNLESLGLHIGNVVAVTRKSCIGGPVVVTFRNTEVAIGKRLAKKIRVQEV